MFESLPGAELAAALAAASAPTGAPAGDPTGPADPTDAADSGEQLGELVDRVTACDRLIGWATAAQAKAVAGLAAGYEQHYLDDLPAAASWEHRSEVRAEAVKDTVVELGLARTTGINAASNLLRLADELVTDHPQLLGLLETGAVPVWNIRAVLAETRVLDSELRRKADVELVALLPGMSWAEATQAAARVVIDLDATAAAARAQTARTQRSVWVRPGRDSMGSLGANLPAEQTQACWHALDDHARGLRADGDPRSLQHLMCDTLVERLTGVSKADRLPVRVDVAVCASTLAGVDNHPAQLRGYGPIPSPVLNQLLAGPDVVLRRLVSDPIDDHVVSIDSKQRFFRGELRDLIRTQDPICVLPGCDRPAVQIDHVQRYADGGTTSAGNALGVCTRHNLAHENPGHRLHTNDRDGDRQTRQRPIFWITLANKIYRLLHPPALGPGAIRRRRC